MDDVGWLGKFFSWQLAAWSAFLLNAVALWKVLPGLMAHFNERQRDLAAERERDIDLIRHERDIALEERDMVRDRWAECQRTSAERLARAVIAEAELIGLNKALGRPTMLPGSKGSAVEGLADKDMMKGR